MKNFTLLLVATLSLSVAYAQTPHHPVIGGTPPTPAIPVNPSLTALNPVANMPAPPNPLAAKGNNSNTGARAATQPRTAIVEYDSVIVWGDTALTLSWLYNTKKIDITYDANYNNTGYILLTYIGGAWDTTSKYTFIYNSSNDKLNETIQTWSSGVWMNDEQYIYTYTSNNEELTELDETGSGSTWVPNDSTTIMYDANYNDTSYTSLTYNGSAWVNDYQFIFTYDNNNNETGKLYNLGSGTTWTPDFQDKYYFNSDNNPTGNLHQTYSGAWMNSTLDTFLYTGSNETTEIDEAWSAGWDSTYKYLWTFNSNNDRTSETDQYWGVMSWVTEYYYAWGYNSSNDNTSYLEQDYIGGTLTTQDSSTYTYNSNHYRASELDQTWSGIAWVNDDSITLTYNTDNEEISYLYQLYNGSAWVNDDKTSYTFNSSGSETSILFQLYIGGNWVNSSLSNYAFDINNIEQWYTDKNYSVTGDTITEADSTHYYFTVLEGINVLSDNAAIQIYPNPAGNIIHTNIQLKQTENLQLRMVNMVGQNVWSADAGNVSNYQNNIPVANLPDGVYLLELITGNGIQSREVLVTH
jgi:hypothetical protein